MDRSRSSSFRRRTGRSRPCWTRFTKGLNGRSCILISLRCCEPTWNAKGTSRLSLAGDGALGPQRILPGKPAPEGRRDPRWQAIIRVGEFLETQPEVVWQFAHRWGKHGQADLRLAVATCLLEHLLGCHFEWLFPRVRRAALESPCFADTLRSCWR